MSRCEIKFLDYPFWKKKALLVRSFIPSITESGGWICQSQSRGCDFRFVVHQSGVGIGIIPGLSWSRSGWQTLGPRLCIFIWQHRRPRKLLAISALKAAFCFVLYYRFVRRRCYDSHRCSWFVDWETPVFDLGVDESWGEVRTDRRIASDERYIWM